MYSIDSLSLYKSVGIHEGADIKLINEPENLFSGLNEDVNQYVFHKHLKQPVDLIHLFTRSKKELSVELPSLLKYLKHEGVLMITWPKDTERFSSDLDNCYVSEFGTNVGLVEAGSYSLGNNWSTLTFMNKPIQKND
jgi:hypothetical protein